MPSINTREVAQERPDFINGRRNYCAGKYVRHPPPIRLVNLYGLNASPLTETFRS
jgi:hypothetical protein